MTIVHNHIGQSVLHTPAGYYVGVFCPVCGPISRDSEYMSEAEAKELLASWAEDEDPEVTDARNNHVQKAELAWPSHPIKTVQIPCAGGFIYKTLYDNGAIEVFTRGGSSPIFEPGDYGYQWELLDLVLLPSITPQQIIANEKQLP